MKLSITAIRRLTGAAGARRLRRFTVRNLDGIRLPKFLRAMKRRKRRARALNAFIETTAAGPRLSEPQHSRTETAFLFSQTPQLMGRAAARRAAGRGLSQAHIPHKGNCWTALRSACVLASIVFLPFLSHAATNEAPDFKEVYELLRANLAGTDEAGLNRAAVQGLLTQIAPGAALLGEKQSGLNPEAAIRTAVFDGAYGYLRIGQVGAGTDKQVSTAYEHLS